MIRSVQFLVTLLCVLTLMTPATLPAENSPWANHGIERLPPVTPRRQPTRDTAPQQISETADPSFCFPAGTSHQEIEREVSQIYHQATAPRSPFQGHSSFQEGTAEVGMGFHSQDQRFGCDTSLTHHREGGFEGESNVQLGRGRIRCTINEEGKAVPSVGLTAQMPRGGAIELWCNTEQAASLKWEKEAGKGRLLNKAIELTGRPNEQEAMFRLSIPTSGGSRD